MQVGEAVRQAMRTLRTQPLRTFLTLFGVGWGTAAVVFLLSWGLGVQRMLEAGYGRVGRNLVQAWPGKIGEDFTAAFDRRQLWFTLDDVGAVRARVRRADLVLASSRMWASVTWRQRDIRADVRGVQAAELGLRGASIAAGRPLTSDDDSHRRRVAVLGDEARRRLLGPSSGVGAWIRIDGRPFQVVGLLDRIGAQLWQDGPTPLNEQVWIPLGTFFAFGPRRGVADDVVDAILMRVRDAHEYDALKRDVRAVMAERLRVSPSDDEAVMMASPIDALRQLPMSQMSGLLLVLGATTLVIGGLGILTMMLDAVQERRQEIGVRLAVGARRRDVVGQFFLETMVITGVGGLTGLALGVGGCWFLGRMETPDLIPTPILRAQVVGLALGVMVGVGIASGIVPAWRAARIDPSITLRAE